jgi:hypothetical protein
MLSISSMSAPQTYGSKSVGLSVFGLLSILNALMRTPIPWLGNPTKENLNGRTSHRPNFFRLA